MWVISLAACQRLSLVGSPAHSKQLGVWKQPDKSLCGRGRGSFKRPRRPAALAASSLDTSSPEQPDTSLCGGELVAAPSPAADNVLGELFLRLVPGPLYYLVSFTVPLSAVLAAWGATHASSILGLVAPHTSAQHVSTLGAQLAALALSRRASTAISVALSLSATLYVFLVVPLMDMLLGRDLRNPSPQEAAAEVAACGPLYRAVVRAHVPAHYLTLLCAAHAACAGGLHPLAALGMTVSMGCCGTTLFTVAHELSHGCKLDRWLAGLLLAPAFYLHWVQSHLEHHVKVATPEDPASARRGETLWAFVPRSVIGNLADGYGAEVRRLEARGIPLLSLQNRMVWWLASPLLLTAAAFAAYGWAGVAFLLGQAALAVFILEAVNYLEHYGLTRRLLPSGRYERVSPRHSWNAAWMWSNAAAFRLMRHSDHHESAGKPYQALCDARAAPQLPADYTALILLAAVPPLFFRVMHPLLDRYQQLQDGQPAGSS